MPESALKRTIDFSKVPDSRRPSAHVPPGDYLLEVVSIEITKSNNGPWENVGWQFGIVGNPGAGVVYETTTLKEGAEFAVRDLLVAFGMNIPKGKAGIDFAKFMGKKVGASLVDNTYNKLNRDTGHEEERTNSKVGVFFPANLVPSSAVVNHEVAEDPVEPAPAIKANGKAPAAAAAQTVAVASEETEEVTELEFVDEDI